MVGTAGIEPATPAMSMQCSPAELRALEAVVYSEMDVFGKPREGLRRKMLAGKASQRHIHATFTSHPHHIHITFTSHSHYIHCGKSAKQGCPNRAFAVIIKGHVKSGNPLGRQLSAHIY